MHLTKRLWPLVLGALAFSFGAGIARAQEAPPEATPAPLATQPPSDQMTPMDRAYDGRLHVTLAPYLWLPTLRSNVKYTIPKLPTGAGGAAFATNVQVGPSDYLTKLNSAGMFSFNARAGAAEFFGDEIFTNLSSNATFNSTISGPVGKLKIPVSITSNSRVATSIWELGAGFSLAHGHNADLNLFIGWRQFPLTTTLSYTATVGSRVKLTRAGTVKITPLANDVIFGFNGKAFLGDNHWFAPYYIDIGSGSNQQTWEGYTGGGYMFNHGQTMILAVRSLNYYGFSSNSPVQKLNMWGPLFGYTFGL